MQSFVKGGTLNPSRGSQPNALHSQTPSLAPSPAPSLSLDRQDIVQDKDFGAFEQHTKGIGLKLLKKMGFKGRLGKRENGRLNPIRVQASEKVVRERVGKRSGIAFENVSASDVNALRMEQRERKSSRVSKRKAEVSLIPSCCLFVSTCYFSFPRLFPTSMIACDCVSFSSLLLLPQLLSRSSLPLLLFTHRIPLKHTESRCRIE